MTADDAEAERSFTELCIARRCAGFLNGVPWEYWPLDPSVEADAERAAARGKYSLKRILGRVRGYAGQLLCSQEFFSQWQQLKDMHGNVISSLRYPIPRLVPAQLEQVKITNLHEAEFWVACWQCATRWCVDRMAWDGLPSPCPPLRPIFASAPVLAQWSDMGIFVFVPWYFKVDSAEPLPRVTEILAMQGQRDRGLAILAGKYGGRPRRLKGHAPPASDFHFANYAALCEEECPHLKSTSRLKGTDVTIEDLLHGSPALLPGARLQEKESHFANAFLYTCRGSEIIRRYRLARGQRGLLDEVLATHLSIGHSSLNNLRRALRPTRHARHAVGLILP